MTEVKICGINSPEAFDAATEAGADYLGFVFFERSPRYLAAAAAAALSSRAQGGPRRVGLFVEPQADAVRAVLETMHLDILQVYGGIALCQELRRFFHRPVWRAIGVAGTADLPADTQELDGFIIEAKPPPNATRPGGNAAPMDWRLLENWQSPAFWLLGGGLTPANVIQAIRQTGAPGVDVSSGVETAPGRKSPALIRDFIAAVRVR